MRTIAGWLILATSAYAQEGTVSFDPRETGGLVFDWQTLILGILMCLVLIVFWRLVAKGVRRNAARFRYWLPTGMMVTIWTVFLVTDFLQLPERSVAGGILLAIIVVIALVNLPLVPVLIVFSLVFESLHLPPWLLMILATLAGWWSWYAIVRLLERRARVNAFVSLRL